MKMTKETRDDMLAQIKDILNGAFSRKTSLLTILFTVFVTLKLTGYISWSWWWVTAPLWGGIALFLLVIILVILLVFLAYLIS